MRAIFIFFNQAHSKINSWILATDFQHVDAFFYSYNNWWVNRLTSRGITLRKSTFENENDLLNHAKSLNCVSHILMVEIHNSDVQIISAPYILSCNEIARYVTKVNIGFTLTPYHLYTKLIKYDHISNYTIANHWSATDGRR